MSLQQQDDEAVNRKALAGAIAYAAAKNGLRVLLCAASNEGVDNIASSVFGAGIDIVRSYAKSRQGCFNNLNMIALHILAKDYEKKEAVVNNAEVVATTCAAAYDYPINEKYYDVVIVDETHLAEEPECLIPISLAKYRLILLGPQEGLVGRLIMEGNLTPIKLIN
eukprot:TRINITY_DN2820_c0_g1_i1.p3 TRINITY_DN2820_c0_g1~~TRINITY_DN2820_c0_g1_i1.p3  ORF type:complete len:166 (-),score=14.68 TRINITY_DN2820_c0_g1_i1:71-568(-)